MDKSRQDQPGAEFEVTPEMIEVSVRILAEEEGIIGHTAAASIAEDLFRSMMAEKESGFDPLTAPW
jgi:hypothetical protein